MAHARTRRPWIQIRRIGERSERQSRSCPPFPRASAASAEQQTPSVLSQLGRYPTVDSRRSAAALRHNHVVTDLRPQVVLFPITTNLRLGWRRPISASSTSRIIKAKRRLNDIFGYLIVSS